MPSAVTSPSAPAPATAARLAALVMPAAFTLIIAQLVVRGWLVATGNFYWDDLILIGRASTMPILSWEFLGNSHDGHFMPAAFLVAGISTVVAPVQWVAPALTLVILQALASLAVWRMIRVLLASADGPRDVTRDLAGLGALAFYLVTPMTVPAFIWWSAGLNSLPFQAAMAWIIADAVIAVRDDPTPRRRRLIVIRSAVIFVVALAFFEKSLYIVPVALVVAVLVARFASPTSSPAPTSPGPTSPPTTPDDEPDRDAHLGPLGIAVVRARALWAALGAIFVAWVLLFLSVSDATAGAHSLSQTAQLVWRSINRAVVPSLVGGPWDWERWIPSPPMGFPAVWMIVAGWVVVAAFTVWAVRARRGVIAVLVCAALYVVIAQVPVMWNRSSANTALELAQTMRYLPDSALVIVAALALVIAAPARSTRRHRHEAATTDLDRDRHSERGPILAVGVAVLAALAVASSLISTASYQSSWSDDPTGPYLANAKKSLAANRNHPMFDQALPLEVLLPVAYPYNQISATFGRLADRPDFGSWTDKLSVLDTAGNLTPGAVTPRRTFAAGSGTCARPELTGADRLQLDGPLIQWRWTVALGYCANAAGTVELSLQGGPAVRVPVQAGLHVVYVQLDGRGTAVAIAPITPGLALHTGDGRVGEVVDARLLGQ
ncbi:hypothetical protein [Gordonia sp. NPDC003950]